MLTVPTQLLFRTIRENVFLQCFPEKDFMVLINIELQISPVKQEWLSDTLRWGRRGEKTWILTQATKTPTKKQERLCPQLSTNGVACNLALVSSLSELREPTSPGDCTLLSLRSRAVSSCDELGHQPGAQENQTLAGDTGHHSPAAAPYSWETPTLLDPKPFLSLEEGTSDPK